MVEKFNNYKTKRIGEVEYWTSGSAAKYLGVCKNTLYAFCNDGLTYLKLGWCLYFTKDWLDDYIQERTKMQTYPEAK